MSLRQKVREIIDQLAVAEVRLDVAQTLFFLFDVYASGRVSEEEIKRDLFDVALTVVNIAKPDLSLEEKREEAGRLAEELMLAFKREGIRRRLLSKYRFSV